LNRIAPPHAMQPPSLHTTLRISSSDKFTLVNTSIASAVPAGEVIARDDVLGIEIPRDAITGTTIMVVRLPGKPPTQCLSATISKPQLILLPLLIMALVRKQISCMVILPEHAVTK